MTRGVLDRQFRYTTIVYFYSELFFVCINIILLIHKKYTEKPKIGSRLRIQYRSVSRYNKIQYTNKIRFVIEYCTFFLFITVIINTFRYRIN